MAELGTGAEPWGTAMALSRSSGGWPRETMAPSNGRAGTACSTAPRAVVTDFGDAVGRLWFPLRSSSPAPSRNNSNVSPRTMSAGLVLGPGGRLRGPAVEEPVPSPWPLVRGSTAVVAAPPPFGSGAPERSSGLGMGGLAAPDRVPLGGRGRTRLRGGG